MLLFLVQGLGRLSVYTQALAVMSLLGAGFIAWLGWSTLKEARQSSRYTATAGEANTVQPGYSGLQSTTDSWLPLFLAGLSPQ